MSLAQWLQGRWFERRLHPALLPLLPLSLLFGFLAGRRRRLYRRGRLRSEVLPVPVVVVGNLTVGGAGKTPLTLWLVRQLKARGRRPAIVSRGYGGSAALPRPVGPGDAPSEVGDEPLLLAGRSGVPVWVGRDRAAAARALLAAHPEVDMVVCDDGLQHYRLGRDAEVAVFDGRGAGNRRLLPTGPLREPLDRLATVDAVIFNGPPDPAVRAAAAGRPAFEMRLQPGEFYRLDDPGRRCRPEGLAGRSLHAVCGIGNPERFFATLRGLGLDFAPHAFPDHHVFGAADLACGPGAVLLMTEKDAVKCRGLAVGEAWVLPVAAELDPALIDVLLEKICGRPTS